MEKNDVFITHSLQELLAKVSVSDIPEISNSLYTISLEKSDEGFFVMKKTADASLIESLDTQGQYEITEEKAAMVRAWYMNLCKNQYLDRDFLECFTSKNFTGIILCGLPVVIKQEKAFGISSVVHRAVYQAEVVQVTGVEFYTEKPDVSKAKLSAWLEGEIEGSSYEDQNKTFCICLRKACARVNQSKVSYANLLCQLQLNEIFSTGTVMQLPAELCGIYQQMKSGTTMSAGYIFPNTSAFRMELEQGALSTVEISHIVGEMQDIPGAISLTLRCAGKMKFARISATYDLFSYGAESNHTGDGGVMFQSLQFRFMLKEEQGHSTREMDYRNIVLQRQGSVARKESFAAQFTHGCPGFVSYQNGITPEQMRFTRILTPFPQKKLGTFWYGITIPITVFGNLPMELLFAFDGWKLYIGSRMDYGKGSAYLSIATSAPFRIQMKAMLLQVREIAGKKQYGFLFKGVSASILGITMPEGNCNLFLTEDTNGQSAWYAVYGNRKKGEKNGSKN